MLGGQPPAPVTLRLARGIEARLRTQAEKVLRGNHGDPAHGRVRGADEVPAIQLTAAYAARMKSQPISSPPTRRYRRAWSRVAAPAVAYHPSVVSLSWVPG